jgi:hypothetical protein
MGDGRWEMGDGSKKISDGVGMVAKVVNIRVESLVAR